MAWHIAIDDNAFYATVLLQDAIEDHLRNNTDYANESDLCAAAERKLQAFYAEVLGSLQSGMALEKPVLTDDELIITHYEVVVRFELRHGSTSWAVLTGARKTYQI